MAHDTNYRPKDDRKKPQKNDDHRDWVRNDFDEPASGSPKDGRCCQADEERKFAAHDVAKPIDFSCGGACFGLSRHGCEHIQSAQVMQSEKAIR